MPALGEARFLERVHCSFEPLTRHAGRPGEIRCVLRAAHSERPIDQPGELQRPARAGVQLWELVRRRKLCRFLPRRDRNGPPYTPCVPPRIGLVTHPFGEAGLLQVVPVVDDVPLTDQIDAFERMMAMDPPGGYAGLVPAYFNFGDARAHYLAHEGAFLTQDGKIPLLGCQCGEWGCWPLLGRVVVEDETVTWREFEQPHREHRHYAAFGPFVFDRGDYEAAVTSIEDAWSSQ